LRACRRERSPLRWSTERRPSPVTNISREQLENLPTGRRLEDLITTCPASTIPTVSTKPQILIDGRPTAPSNSIDCVQPSDVRMIEVYKAHNQARYEVGSRPLVWDPVLAAQAASYGPELAQYGRPVHSSRVGRETSRENLLQALPGTSPKAMVGVWTAEAKYFRNGIFPDVSTTGNWADVGHWTQMVWPATTNLGCAAYQGGQFDWLICRYSPPGNKDGKMVLAEREKEAPLPPTMGGRALHPSGIPQPQTAPYGYDPCSGFYEMQISGNRDGRKPQQADAPKPPPESILDDVGENSPPPESILDDVGDMQTGDTPAPLPKLEKGKAVHDKPMPQPQGPSTPPQESILDDVGQDGACRPAPATPKPTGIVGQPSLQPAYIEDYGRELEVLEFYLDGAARRCDATAYAQRLAEVDAVRQKALKVAKDAGQVGPFANVSAGSYQSIAERAGELIENGNGTLSELRKTLACSSQSTAP
jgi:hypothetical protein